MHRGGALGPPLPANHSFMAQCCQLPYDVQSVQLVKLIFWALLQALRQLERIEHNLISNELPRTTEMLVRLHGESARQIDELTEKPIQAGYKLLEVTGSTLGTDGVKMTLDQLEAKKIFLGALCVAHKEEHRRILQALDNFNQRQSELQSWLIGIAEAFLQGHQDMGSDIKLAQDFIDLHTQLLRDVQVSCCTA